jgi:hypothetical protein
MTVKYADLQDRRQVFESLNVSASGEGGGGGFSGSASANFAKSVDIKTERRNLLATIDSMKGGEQWAPAEGELAVRLTKSALDKASNAGDFRNVCGDGYVAAIRKGARLNGVLSFAMDDTEVKESLKVSATASYGAAKGKASMERIRLDTTNVLKTDVSVLQIGGDRSAIPATAVAFIEKIQNFGEYSAEQSVPLEVIVFPYRVLGDVPDNVRNRPLPDLGVRELSLHYWRLSDLSNFYSRASMNQSNFYHPFVPQDQLVSKARTLQNAALCVADMLDLCHSKGTVEACSLYSLTKMAVIRTSCLQRDPAASASELLELSEMAVGTRLARTLVMGAEKLSTPIATAARQVWDTGVKDAMTLEVSARVLVAGEAKEKSEMKSMFAARTTPRDFNTYDIWYHNYARAPWPKQLTVEGKAHAGTDLSILLASFCLARNLNCENLNLAKLAGGVAESASLPGRAQTFINFVVASRLYPVAVSVCETQLQHPLCQLPDVLEYYVQREGIDSGPVLTPERGFLPLASPPAVIPAKKPPRAEPRTPSCYSKFSNYAC